MRIPFKGRMATFSPLTDTVIQPQEIEKRYNRHLQ